MLPQNAQYYDLMQHRHYLSDQPKSQLAVLCQLHLLSRSFGYQTRQIDSELEKSFFLATRHHKRAGQQRSQFYQVFLDYLNTGSAISIHRQNPQHLLAICDRTTQITRPLEHQLRGYFMLGAMDEAYALLPQVNRQRRHAMKRCLQTGVVQAHGTQTFIGNLLSASCIDQLIPSALMLQNFVRHWSGAYPARSAIVMAETWMEKLSKREQLIAYPDWLCFLAMQEDLAVALNALKAIPYRSVQQRVLFALFQQAMVAHRHDEAERIQRQITQKIYQDRCHGLWARGSEPVSEEALPPSIAEHMPTARETCLWQSLHKHREAADLSWPPQSGADDNLLRSCLAELNNIAEFAPHSSLGKPVQTLTKLLVCHPGWMVQWMVGVQPIDPTPLLSNPHLPQTFAQRYWEAYTLYHCHRLMVTYKVSPSLPQPSEDCALSPIRTDYDEQVSLSLQAGQKRVALTQASKYVIRSMIDCSEQFNEDVFQQRVHILINLSGARIRQYLHQRLGDLSPHHQTYDVLWFALLQLSPNLAADALFDSLITLPPLSPDFIHRLDRLTSYGLLERGFAATWKMVIGALKMRFKGERVDQGIAGLFSHWRSITGQFPSINVIRGLLSYRSRKTLPEDPAHYLADAEQILNALRALPRERMVKRLYDKPAELSTLVAFAPANLPMPHKTWSLTRWRNVLQRCRDIGVQDVDVVFKAAKDLFPAWIRRTVANQLIQGKYPLSSGGTLCAGAHFRLTYLDKGQHPLTFLRFADVKNCCFNSRSGYFDHYDSQANIIALWLDPMSFCFHIETRDTQDPQGWRACGFIFGGFGLAEQRPTLLLNGLYLKAKQTQVAQIRLDLMHALEQQFAIPLGIRQLAIANRYGGRGELPAGYQRKKCLLYRYRALQQEHTLHSHVYDDICTRVNQWVDTRHLFWRTLSDKLPGRQ